MVVHSVVAWDDRPECVIDETRVLDVSQLHVLLTCGITSDQAPKASHSVLAVTARANELKHVKDGLRSDLFFGPFNPTFRRGQGKHVEMLKQAAQLYSRLLE